MFVFPQLEASTPQMNVILPAADEESPSHSSLEGGGTSPEEVLPIFEFPQLDASIKRKNRSKSIEF